MPAFHKRRQEKGTKRSGAGRRIRKVNISIGSLRLLAHASVSSTMNPADPELLSDGLHEPDEPIDYQTPDTLIDFLKSCI